MLLSRFWYLILSFALVASAGILYIAFGFYNRHTERWLNEALMADATTVAWYMKDDARTRAAALLPVALSGDLREPLAKASESDEVSKDVREKARQALNKAAGEIPEDLKPKFYAIFAVDVEGRVIAQWNYAHREDWNIGGHAVVADALAGWIRDDAWVIQEKLYRVVARPVERDGGGEPVGAIVGLTAVDAAYAQKVAEDTGTRIAFYVLGQRDVNALPPSAANGNESGQFLQGDFDVMASDIKSAASTEDYLQKGRSLVRRPRQDIGLVYTRIPGESWDLGSGYIVARKVTFLKTPLGFFQAADQSDKDRVPQNALIAIALGLGILGILFSIVEHTLPLRTFQRVVHQFALGKIDTLAPSRFRGLYKKFAADINDGVDKALAKGGITRRAADLESVIGPLPAQPQMSAFAVPEAAPAPPPPPKVPSAPEKRKVPPPPRAGDEDVSARSSPGAVAPSDLSAESELGSAVVAPPAEPAPPPGPPPPRGSRAGRPLPPRARPVEEAEVSPASQPASGIAPSPMDELAEWKQVYEEFIKTKKQCGEATEGLTFDRFKGTLERNKAALVSKHNCSGVKFTVYVKDSKAALRASPVK